MKGRRSFIPLLTAVALAFTGVLLVITWITPGATPVAQLDETKKFHACRSSAIELIKPEKTDIALLKDLNSHCYDEIYAENRMGDYNLRRTTIIQQQFQGNVMLWMVVAITMSGVLLAAVQLVAAYQLAAVNKGDLGQGGEITLEEKKISLKSSVTGLLILAVSFSFFISYVKWVYPLTAVHIDVDDGTTAPNRAEPSGVGHLGPPPSRPTEQPSPDRGGTPTSAPQPKK
jgi:hypothetical protein